MENEIKIRPLTVRDRKKFSALLIKLSGIAGDKSITSLISSQVSGKSTEGSEKDTNEAYAQIGLTMLKKALEVLEEDTQKMFADLIDKSLEEFLELPIDTEVEIMNQIVEAQEVSNFFTKALHLYNKTKKYLNRQGVQKTE